MKKKIGIALIIIAVAILAIAVSYFMLKKNQKNQGATTSPTPTASSDQKSATTSAGTSATAAADWHLYKNTEYNFQLTFSDAWKDYKVEKSKTPKNNSLAEYDFGIKGTTLLTIYVYDREGWDKIAEADRRSTELTKTTKYAYTYFGNDSPPADLSSITDKEIADTLKTFKVQ